MKTLHFIFLFSLVSFFACNDTDIPSGTPQCIEDKIDQFKKDRECGNGAYVNQYEFKGSLVYGFWDGDCGADFAEIIYNSNCEVICSLAGFSGNTMCDGVVFNDVAKDQKTLWSN